MKIRHPYKINGKEIEITHTHIPFRYIITIVITILEILAIIGIVLLLCNYVPYFYILAIITQIACVIKIISSDDNPDYKAPWLLVVMVLPVAGFMLYFIFYSRNLDRKYAKRFSGAANEETPHCQSEVLSELHEIDPIAESHVKMLNKISRGKLYQDCGSTYYPSGEAMLDALIPDLNSAQNFIFLEFFIIEDGIFWNSILDVLKDKSNKGVEVRVLYDDIGCMKTLPPSFVKDMSQFGISAFPFSKLKGQADSEFNNRNHRKLLIIDGKIGYTGGINLADEYINKVKRFGHWKDSAIRIEGEAVNEMTRLFLIDYHISSKDKFFDTNRYYIEQSEKNTGEGYLLPFGDGPKPLYTRSVSKLAIENLLSYARDYVYITTPYLIIDNDMCSAIEATALRGVNVTIIVPHIPDKKIVFEITKSFYQRLSSAGVKIYEYSPGFIHSKIYIADGKYAIIGSMNLDYRSLVHHFENGVWMYGNSSIADMVHDFEKVLSVSERVDTSRNVSLIKRLIRSIGRIFAPLM